MFDAAQEKDSLNRFRDMGILTDAEEAWLKPAYYPSRVYVVLGWLTKMWEDIKGANLVHKFNFVLTGDEKLLGAKGSVGMTLAILGTPLPYSYVHVVYWTVQILLCILAVETGITLALLYDRKGNGNEEYQYDDGSESWPNNSRLWYLNEFLQITCGNIIFALFTVGILKISERLASPMSGAESSYAEFDLGKYQ